MAEKLKEEQLDKVSGGAVYGWPDMNMVEFIHSVGEEVELNRYKDFCEIHQYTKHGKIMKTGIIKPGDSFSDAYYIDTGDSWTGWYDRDFDVRKDNRDRKVDWALLFEVQTL